MAEVCSKPGEKVSSGHHVGVDDAVMQYAPLGQGRMEVSDVTEPPTQYAPAWHRKHEDEFGVGRYQASGQEHASNVDEPTLDVELVGHLVLFCHTVVVCRAWKAGVVGKEESVIACADRSPC